MNVDSWPLLSAIARALVYASVLLSAGGLAFRLSFAKIPSTLDDYVGRVARRAAWIGIAAAGVSVPILGGHLAGEVSGMTDAAMLGAVMATSTGQAVTLCIAGLALIIACSRGTGAFPRFAALAGGGLALTSFTQTGHLAARGELLLQSLLLVHLCCVAYWIGSLIPLRRLTLPPYEREICASAAARFGIVALFVVAALIAAGGVCAYALLGGPAQLLEAPYGNVLLAKTALVAGLLGLAALNKFRIVPRLRAGDPPAAAALRKSINGEIALAACIMAATAALTSVQPPATG